MVTKEQTEEQRLFEIKDTKKTNRENVILGIVILIALVVVFYFRIRGDL